MDTENTAEKTLTRTIEITEPCTITIVAHGAGGYGPEVGAKQKQFTENIDVIDGWTDALSVLHARSLTKGLNAMNSIRSITAVIEGPPIDSATAEIMRLARSICPEGAEITGLAITENQFDVAYRLQPGSEGTARGRVSNDAPPIVSSVGGSSSSESGTTCSPGGGGGIGDHA